MTLDNIQEEGRDKVCESLPDKSGSRARSESLDVIGNRRTSGGESRNSSRLLAAAGIDFERRRRQMHSQSLTGSIGPVATGESRIFQNGGQWMEEKDGKITKLEILEEHEKMGPMRKSVPLLPVSVAILLCILNVILPSSGTFIGTGAMACCSVTCRHVKRSKGIKYGLLAGFLQLLFTPLLVGWIYSIYYGANIVQDAVSHRLTEYQSQDNHKTANTRPRNKTSTNP